MSSRVLITACAAAIAFFGCTRSTELGSQEQDHPDAGSGEVHPPLNDGGIDGPVIPVLPTDGGCAFTPVDGIDGANVTALAAQQDVVIAGTRSGMFRSTDTGKTWAPMRALANEKISGLVSGSFGWMASVEDVDGTTLLYVCEDAGVWLPADEGLPDALEATDLSIADGAPLLISVTGEAFAFDSESQTWSSMAAPEGTIALATLGEVTVAVTKYGTEIQIRDGNSEWTPAVLDPPASVVQRVWTTEAGFVLSTPDALYTSPDGTTFTAIALPPGELFGPDAVLRPSEQLVGAFRNGVWRTSNGVNWERLGDAITRPTELGQALASDGSRLFVGTAEGVLRSESGGGGLALSNHGLTGTRVIAVDATDETVIASTGGARLYRSTDAGDTFLQGTLYEPDAKFTALGRNGATVFAGTDRFGIYRSMNDGASFLPANVGFPLSPGIAGGSYLEVHAIAAGGETVLAGLATGIARSTNGGDSWTVANSGLPIVATDPFDNPIYPSVDALSVVDGIFFASTTSGLFRSTDGGATWEDVTGDLPTNADGSAATLSAVVSHGKALFAAGSRWSDGTLPVLVRSDDGGAHWVDLSKNIPSGIAVTGFTSDGENLFAVLSHQPSTNADSFQTSKDGLEWKRIAAAPRASWLRATALTSDAVFIGTDGNGLTRLSFASCD